MMVKEDYNFSNYFEVGNNKSINYGNILNLAVLIGLVCFFFYGESRIESFLIGFLITLSVIFSFLFWNEYLAKIKAQKKENVEKNEYRIENFSLEQYTKTIDLNQADFAEYIYELMEVKSEAQYCYYFNRKFHIDISKISKTRKNDPDTSLLFRHYQKKINFHAEEIMNTVVNLEYSFIIMYMEKKDFNPRDINRLIFSFSKLKNNWITHKTIPLSSLFILSMDLRSVIMKSERDNQLKE